MGPQASGRTSSPHARASFVSSMTDAKESPATMLSSFVLKRRRCRHRFAKTRRCSLRWGARPVDGNCSHATRAASRMLLVRSSRPRREDTVASCWRIAPLLLTHSSIAAIAHSFCSSLAPRMSGSDPMRPPLHSITRREVMISATIALWWV